MEFIDVSAKTIEDAIAKGVAELSIDGRELVETKVIEQPSNGFLGIGRKPAVVRLFYTMVSAAATEEEKEVIAETSDAVWMRLLQLMNAMWLNLLMTHRYL